MQIPLSLRPNLQNLYDAETWKSLLQDLFPVGTLQLMQKPVQLTATHENVEKTLQLGNLQLGEDTIALLEVETSDLLQANGVIWVEGPSDCLYVNKWIEIISEGRLKEGRDYQCAFYGGALLARTQFTSPEEAEKGLINLLRVNPNIAVICDGDRTAPAARLKGRVRKIKAQIEKIPNTHLWITEAREIENYLPGESLKEAYDKPSLPDPGQFACFFHKKSEPTKSYLEKHFKKQSIDKMELAVLTTPHMTFENMTPRFDWLKEVTKLVETIRGWNA